MIRNADTASDERSRLRWNPKILGTNVSWIFARAGGKHSTQMPDFCVDLGGIGHGLGHFFAEKTAVTLPQAMHQTFYRRLGHSQGARKRGVGDVLPLGGQATAQSFKGAQAPLAFAFFPQPAQRLLDYS